MFRKIIMCATALLLTGNIVFAQDALWHNDLRTKFLNNQTVIMEINLRSFNANDIDGDGFIQENNGETRGTFLNAIDRLDELKNLGVNTLHILPVTPVGKLKALGTAGSLYAASGFDSLNEQLKDKNSALSIEEQAKEFINEAHKRNIRIIMDVPACGSYDLYLQSPDLFLSGTSGEPIVPSDWTDVRLLNGGTSDKINADVFNLYKDYVNMMLELGVDGIRADVAQTKSAEFWKELIEYTKDKNPEFLWLAEVSDSWKESVSPSLEYTSYDMLLNAGFDGYYGSFFNLKDWTNSKELYKQFAYTFNDLGKYKEKKAVIGAFSTHDEVSPILLKGEKLSEMITWLSATLPVNSYFTDGFQTGDDYIYKNANKLATESSTDDDTYFMHRGKLDIFNFSRKPGGDNIHLKNEFLLANNVKESLIPLLNEGTFTPLKTNRSNVFAYSFGNSHKKVITIGNLDFENSLKAVVKIPRYNKKTQNMLPIKISTMPAVKNNRLSVPMAPGETVVIIIYEQE